MNDLHSLAQFIGGAAVLVGALMASSLLPPNPVIGVRTCASFSSRDEWDRVNRAGGLALALAGIVTVALNWLIAHALTDGLRSSRTANVLSLLPLYFAALRVRRWARRSERDVEGNSSE